MSCRSGLGTLWTATGLLDVREIMTSQSRGGAVGCRTVVEKGLYVVEERHERVE